MISSSLLWNQREKDTNLLEAYIMLLAILTLHKFAILITVISNLDIVCIHTAQFASIKKGDEILTRFHYHGCFSWPFAYHLPAKWKLYLYIRQRYGYPDIQKLATLKQKIWIHGFLMVLVMDPGEILIFRGAISCLTVIFCSILATLI